MPSARRTIASRRSPRVRANDSPARQSRRLNQPYRLTTNGTARSPSCNQPCAVRVSTVQPFSTNPVASSAKRFGKCPSGRWARSSTTRTRRSAVSRPPIAVIPHPYSHTMGYRGKLAAQATGAPHARREHDARRHRRDARCEQVVGVRLGPRCSVHPVPPPLRPATTHPPGPHRQAPPDRGARRARRPTHRHPRRARLPRGRRRALRGRRRQGRRVGQVREHRSSHDRVLLRVASPLLRDRRVTAPSPRLSARRSRPRGRRAPLGRRDRCAANAVPRAVPGSCRPDDAPNQASNSGAHTCDTAAARHIARSWGSSARCYPRTSFRGSSIGRALDC